MEPPAKRLRILQSVEVDEQNPDYISAKQKQQRKFKGRLESIFAKYGNMHESMSDEIDMRENRVVVDRGHLRRLVRQVNRKETILLDNLGMAAGQEPEEASETEEGTEYSEDELAPTQRPRSNKRRLEDTTGGQHQSPTESVTHSSPSGSSQLDLQHTATSAIASLVAGVQQVPSTPNPATNLLQLVQFPQTPAGQQAQNTFYTTLAHTIDRAVQQAVIPLFSNILATTLNVRLPLTNVLPTPATPLTIDDKVAPATDPKWFFPPLSAESHKQDVAHLSPMPPPASMSFLKNKPSPVIEEDASPYKYDYNTMGIQREISRAKEDMGRASPRSTATEQASSNPQSRRVSPRVEIIQKPAVKRSKYHFSKEDDIYISRKRELEKHTWSEIRNSKQKWKGWPDIVFSYRWRKHLQKEGLHLKEIDTARPDPREPSIHPTAPGERRTLEKEQASLTEMGHLPTPSSLEHEDRPEAGVEYEAEHIGNAMSSGAYFDEDQCDLLSLAGADTDEEQQQLSNTKNEEALYNTQADTILPSVELTEFVNEDTLQQGLLEDLPTNAASLVAVKTEPMLSLPRSNRKRKTIPVSFQAMADSDDEIEDDLEASDVDTNSERVVGSPFLCDICPKTFKSAKNLERHLAQPRATHTKMRPKSISIDLIGDDGVHAPRTPPIKREVSTTPLANSPLSAPAFRTPTLQPQHLSVPSSGSKSTSKNDRKTFLKQVKQSWTKKSTPASKTIAMRRSFHTLPMKRAWASEAESEDELAI